MFLLCAALAMLGVTPAHAGALEDAACYAFAGDEQCRTVSVVDREQCVIKIRPRPIADLDPAVAGCLTDDIGTVEIFLNEAALQDAVVSSRVSIEDDGGPKTTVRIVGRAVARALAAYDENGAPVWESRDSYAVEHGGDLVGTRTALERLSLNFCGPTAAAAAPSEAPAAGDGAAANIISVDEAFRLSAQGKIMLVDVRDEAEWRATGVAADAIPITMRQGMESFVKRLSAAAESDGEKPIALICAHGVRSAYLQRALKEYGFSGVIDVRGGMLGGPQSPGWIKSGLPVTPYNP